MGWCLLLCLALLLRSSIQHFQKTPGFFLKLILINLLPGLVIRLLPLRVCSPQSFLQFYFFFLISSSFWVCSSMSCVNFSLNFRILDFMFLFFTRIFSTYSKQVPVSKINAKVRDIFIEIGEGPSWAYRAALISFYSSQPCVQSHGYGASA